MKEQKQQAFMLRAKPSGIDRLQEALDKDQIVIGWAEAEELLNESLSQDEFDGIFKRRYPDHSPRHMWCFIREMNIGDLVVVPSVREFYVARILGPATYKKSKIADDTAYRRKVEWLNNKKPIAKAKVKLGLQSTLSYQHASCPASQWLKEIKECLMEHSLNTILYGPPGTGKTYNTSHYAVAIIEGKSVVEVVKNENHEEVKNRFDEYRDNGRIEIVTFHQNYAYEDFIEGIRPVLAKGKEEDGNVKYELSKGVFRKISAQATKFRTLDIRTLDIDELLQEFAISIQNELGSGKEIKLSDDGGINDAIKSVDLRRSDFSFKLGGTGEGKSLSMQSIKERRYYHEFLQGKIEGPDDIKPVEESQSPQLGTAPQYFALLNKIKDFHDTKKGNYVLIIDEINRGNIAKIFGELITLIEDSRRLEGTEATEVTLPYSGESFGVPDNLYIIGTMNTADRSIALLDTALRRRFEFKEMMPESVHQKIETNIEGVNLQKLLEKMNERIRVLLDREHQIGHTYFFGVEDMDSLKKAFQSKIIPLLQEYFYDNWEKIDLVLNQNEKGFIKSDSIDDFIDSDRFKKSDLIDKQGKIYEILPEDDPKWDEPKNYINIYTESNKAQNTEQNQPSNE